MADDLLCDPKVSSPDYLFSSMKIGDFYCMDDYQDKGFDGCDDYLNLNWEWKEDVRDLLPSDPFEMEISSGCRMITGWIQEVDEDIGYIKISEKSIGDEINLEHANGLLLFDGSKESIRGKKILHPINESHGDGDPNRNGNDGAPPDALFFALSYLGIKDLLSVESVCKSLRDSIRNDPLLWRSIHIDQPPGEWFGDDSLLRIADRARGSLQSLSIVKCSKITDNGLENVFQRNPGLTELSVLGCIGLSMGGLLRNLNSLKFNGGDGIKRLRIGGLNSVTMEQYEELKQVLSVDHENQLSSLKPRFYHGGHSYLSLDDDRPIDIEACPMCHQLRQVYDCPAESCQHTHNFCRACTFCIPRCINCGCCFNERDYMETFCLDFLCLVCLTQILRFPDGEEEDMNIPSMESGFHQQTSYRFCLYG